MLLNILNNASEHPSEFSDYFLMPLNILQKLLIISKSVQTAYRSIWSSVNTPEHPQKCLIVSKCPWTASKSVWSFIDDLGNSKEAFANF